MSKKIAVLPGDGIGKTVLPEAIRVLDAVGFEADRCLVSPGSRVATLDQYVAAKHPDTVVEVQLIRLGIVGAVDLAHDALDLGHQRLGVAVQRAKVGLAALGSPHHRARQLHVVRARVPHLVRHALILSRAALPSTHDSP